jgi:CIC family chloride channel protein
VLNTDSPTVAADTTPSDGRGDFRHVFLAALVGGAAGLIGSVFHLLINRLILWPSWLAGMFEGHDLIWAAAGITMTCAVLSVFMVRCFAPEASGSGVQEVEGAMEGLRVVRPFRVLPVKFLSGVMAISSGLVLGREGPTIHIGASVAAAVTGWFGSSETERRGMLAAGAAAGLACAFNAPLAAVLFVIEETHKQFPYTFRTYMGVITAAILSTVVTQSIGGTAPDLTLTAAGVPLTLLPAFLGLGVVLGLLGVFLNASMIRAMTFAASCQARVPYVYPAVVGLAIGALFIVLPVAVTGGEAVILELSARDLGVAALLLLALLRFLTMVSSYSTGVPGGIFAPILTLAVCVGLAFGELARMAYPDAGVVPLAFGIAAMGGLFTSSVRAPIVGVALTLELTGSYVLALPLMVTCLTANLVAQWIGGRPIYEEMLDRTLAQAGIAPVRRKKREPVGLA